MPASRPVKYKWSDCARIPIPLRRRDDEELRASALCSFFLLPVLFFLSLLSLTTGHFNLHDLGYPIESIIQLRYFELWHG